jgi:hypothetical protein
MARGGRKTYIRDSNGRFASTGTSTRAGSLGSLRSRTSLKKSRAKLASGNTSPQQRGAVTRASRALARAQVANRRSLTGGRPSSTLAKSPAKRRQAGTSGSAATATPMATSAIRQTGKLSRTVSARSSIRPFSGMVTHAGKRRRQAARAKDSRQKAFDNRVLRAGAAGRQARETISNLSSKKRLSAKDKAVLTRAQKTASISSRALRTYSQPRSKVVKYKSRGIEASISKIDRTVNSVGKLLKSIRDKTEQSKRRIARMNARTIAGRLEPGIGGQVARAELAITGTKAGLDVIRRRSERAAKAAERGSKPAARAREIYATQMAATGPGKPSKGQNTVKPGPRSVKGQEPPKRKKRSRKPKK